MHTPNSPSHRSEPSSRIFLFQVWRHALLARALGIAAELGIADLVVDTPRSSAELAAATGAHADALYRLLRLLASHGVFAEDDRGRFQITPLAGALQTDRDDSVRDALRLRWQDVAWDAYRQLPHAVMTGETAFDRAFGMPRYEWS